MNYLERMKLELRFREGRKGFDTVTCLFGAGIITIPFVLLYTCNLSKLNLNVTKVVNIANEALINTAANSKPKNPSTADPLPDHDLDINTIHPGPIDQHGTYGQAY
jgi:hypothetical protein